MKTSRKNGTKVKKAGKLASAAIRLASRGYAVVPMYTATSGECSCFKGRNCPSPGKHPSTAHGVRDASVKKSQSRRWWRSAPNGNIGIAVGASKLLVLDVDPRNGGAETLVALTEKLGPLNAKVSADTGGGGQHYYFAAPAFAIRKHNAGKILGTGVDILAGNSIAISPPSVHALGGAYRWHDGKSLLEAVPGKLPKTWRAFIRSQQELVKTESGQTTTTEIKEGSRNSELTSIAGTLRNAGIGEESTLAALREENKRRCRPPLIDTDLKKIAKSIGAKPVLAKGAAAGDVAARAMQLTLDQHFSGGKHLMSCDDGQFWHYNGKHWKPISDASVRSRCLKVIQNMPS